MVAGPGPDVLINTGLKGDRMPYVPDLTWSATADYYLPLTNGWSANFGGALRFVDDRTNGTTSARSIAGRRRRSLLIERRHAPLKIDSYSALDLYAVGLQRALDGPRVREERRDERAYSSMADITNQVDQETHHTAARRSSRARSASRSTTASDPTRRPHATSVSTAAMTPIALPAALPAVPRRYDRARLRQDRVRSARLGAGALHRRVSRCPAPRSRTGLPFLTPAQAARAGAQAMVIGVANAGGFIPPAWLDALVEAMEAGLDIISGMHVRLARYCRAARDRRATRAAADRCSQSARRAFRSPPAAARTGSRLLTIGTDCALGKKYTALALARAFQSRGVDATFRATGQTGILIAGGGIPMDAVVADFAAGAAEMLTPDAAPTHWDVIEGQGSLFHPAYAGVSLALLHGSQPDVIVVCHEPGRDRVLGHPDYPVPGVARNHRARSAPGRAHVAAHPLRAASASTPRKLDADEAARVIASESERLGLPVADPIRGGDAFERLVASCLA